MNWAKITVHLYDILCSFFLKLRSVHWQVSSQHLLKQRVRAVSTFPFGFACRFLSWILFSAASSPNFLLIILKREITLLSTLYFSAKMFGSSPAPSACKICNFCDKKVQLLFFHQTWFTSAVSFSVVYL